MSASARVLVIYDIGSQVRLGGASRPLIVGEGLDQIEPSVTLTPVIRAAFAVGSALVQIDGDEYSGAFVRTGDVCSVSRQNNGIGAKRMLSYEFQGWKPKT